MSIIKIHPDQPLRSLSPEDQEFYEALSNVLGGALEIVRDHFQDGENEFLPITQMFPHGSQDIAFLIFTKAVRLLGYLENGQHKKVVEEAQDIINYGGFLIVFETKEE